MFIFNDTAIAGCFEVVCTPHTDGRGKFMKTFHDEEFHAFGLETCFKEEYYSSSKRGVLRGLHFQVPPADHIKLVYAVSGEVFDVVVDLRIGSPTYGSVATFNLSETGGNMVYIPSGLAHGFYCITSEATLIYKTSTVHNPHCDTGILWSSIPLSWPVKAPIIISPRDEALPPLGDFVSPFNYEQ